MAVCPLVSAVVPLTTWPAPSGLTVIGAGHVCTATWSAHANVTVTLVLFHPLAFGAGLAVGVMVGGVESVMVTLSPTISTLSDVRGTPEARRQSRLSLRGA